jgi:hypothetical protein
MGLKKAKCTKHMPLWAIFFSKNIEVTTNIMKWEGRNTDFGSTVKLCSKFMIILGDFLAMAEWPISVEFWFQ